MMLDMIYSKREALFLKKTIYCRQFVARISPPLVLSVLQMVRKKLDGDVLEMNKYFLVLRLKTARSELI
jgi:hypothetical protein